MAIILLQLWLSVVVFVMFVYTTRHLIFTASRLYQRQRMPLGDIFGEHVGKVTVLVPMHNEELVAARCLDALLRSDYPASRLDIVAVDDHSDDGTARILQTYSAFHKNVRVITIAGDARGKANALNVALQDVASEIVLIFDADYTPARGLVRRLAMAFTDPEAGAVMGRVVPCNTNKNILTRLLSMERSGGYQVDQQARYNLDLLPQYGGTVAGFRLGLLREIGGFRADALCEDTELTASIFERGWKVAYDNRAECYEEVPETWPSRFRQLRRWSRGHNLVMFTHLRPVLSAKGVPFRRRLDAVLLLWCFAVPPLLLSGWLAELGLLLAGHLSFLAGIILAFTMVLYNTLGNFAPVYQVAAGEVLDGSGARLLLLPLLVYSFPFNAWTITTGFIDSIGDLAKRRRGVWEKTARSVNTAAS
jgi:cellulose synthase/poly-beta-1,6-N-acetylglucosamine synthase-like glycosyltransferase